MSAIAEPPGKSPPLKLFISYAHEDETYRAALEKYLKILKLQGLIEHWDDRKIIAGDKWEKKINENLELSDIIVLLVSIDFVVSDYSRDIEMRRALERESAGISTVVPVLVRETEGWTNVAGLGTLQALPIKPGVQPEELLPIRDWNDDDKAWGAVLRGLTSRIRAHTKKPAPPPPPAVAAPATGPTTATSAPAAAEASAQAVKALRGWLDDPKMRTVARKFRTDFAAASRQFALLSDLKDLHDHLHNLQFQCFGFLAQELRRGAAGISWESLDEPEIKLRELAQKVQAVAARPSLTGLDLAWTVEIGKAHQALVTAIAGTDPNPLKLLETCVKRIGRVLAFEPLRVNMQLSEAAARLPLAEIEGGMAEARAELCPDDLASPEGRLIDNGVTALSRLHPGVERLTREHTLWQSVDAEMRRIESQVGTDTSDLEISWDGLKTRLEQLCADSPEAPWSSLLREEILKLESALAANAPQKIAQAFRRTYSQAGVRFYDVDFELKKLCDELRNVGTELDKLLAAL